MSNGDLLVLLGLAVAALGIALAVPAALPRPAWMVPALGVSAAVLGLVSALAVLLR